MKHGLILFLVFCAIEDQLNLIRPNAQWKITKGDYDGIVWLDRAQKKPTRSEMDNAFIQCLDLIRKQSIDSVKEKALLDAKDAKLDLSARLDALIKAIEMK